jgi:TrmH family RNA methyltransferase
MSVLRSRDNPRVRRWARLARDARLRRREGRALIEGPHLLAAALDHGLAPVVLIATERGLVNEEIASLVRRAKQRPVVLSESLFRTVVEAEAPQGIAAEIAIPRSGESASGDCVFLEGIQDAGNLGAILRSAAAFGLRDAVPDRGCADAWSPKVLRAAMGAHFTLRVRQSGELQNDLERFGGKLVCAVPSGGTPLSTMDLGGRLGWIFGSEGQGVSEAVMRRAALRVTIPMARGVESLNVAAAAAICFYAAFSTRAARS